MGSDWDANDDFRPDDFVPSEERESHYFVHLRDGTYSAWNSQTLSTERVEYKHHLIKIQTEKDTGDICFGPTCVCGHGEYHQGMEPEPLDDALQNGSTSREQICHHCWKRLPEELQVELGKVTETAE